MTQNQAKVFSGGLESASSVVSSGILKSSWELINNLSTETHSNQNLLFWKKDSKESGLISITFGTTQNHFQSHLRPFSINMDDDDNPFKFICSKTNPSFSLNLSVFSLFNAYRTQLDQLKSEIDLKRPVIVTGHAVGGSIASLFTLRLLEKMEPTKHKRPLCITFGSPLFGDQNFQQAMWQSSNWNSCFLHVASLQDPLILTFSSISNNSYCPFGIFLLCSDYGSSCFESPASILRLLNLISQQNQGLQQNCDYGSVVENLTRKAICRDHFDGTNIIPHLSDLLNGCLALQLCALGFQQLPQGTDLKNLVNELNEKKPFSPYEDLNKMKEKMAHLEWYKKDSKNEKMANLEWYKKDSKNTRRGYYDSFKDQFSTCDSDVNLFIKPLKNYWEKMVEEAEQQPQKEGATFRTKWLYAGTNYRRMVEPLDIAGYYKDGKRDYINQGRSHRYKQLEKWLKDDQKHDQRSQPIVRTNNVENILTLDSCFWAHVEEALISCQKLKDAEFSEAEKREAMKNLDEFEKYVYESLKNYTVSPEIFLEGSSFMRWWGEYVGIRRFSYDSKFASFMKNRANYDKYEKGAYDFP